MEKSKKQEKIHKETSEIRSTSSSMDDISEKGKDVQSEGSIEYEEVNDGNEQGKEKVKVTNELNKEAMEFSQKITENREVYWNRGDILKSSGEIDNTRKENQHNKRYEKDHGRPIKVIITHKGKNPNEVRTL